MREDLENSLQHQCFTETRVERKLAVARAQKHQEDKRALPLNNHLAIEDHSAFSTPHDRTTSIKCRSIKIYQLHLQRHRDQQHIKTNLQIERPRVADLQRSLKPSPKDTIQTSRRLRDGEPNSSTKLDGDPSYIYIIIYIYTHTHRYKPTSNREILHLPLTGFFIFSTLSLVLFF